MALPQPQDRWNRSSCTATSWMLMVQIPPTTMKDLNDMLHPDTFNDTRDVSKYHDPHVLMKAYSILLDLHISPNTILSTIHPSKETPVCRERKVKDLLRI